VPIAPATGCVPDAAIGAGKGKLTGEMAPVRGLHGRLGRGDVPLGDGYYSSFGEVVTLAGMGVDVVMRRHGGRPVAFRRGGRQGRRDHMVEWHRDRNRPAWMGREELAASPRVLTMREPRVRVDEPGSGPGRSWWWRPCRTRRPSPPASWRPSIAGDGMRTWT
jgi:hypothetical protein